MEVTENTQIPIENPILRKAMYKCYGAKCFYTGQLVEFEDMHIDHIIPKSKGGKDCIDNYVFTCSRINLAKNNKTDKHFIERITLINKLLFVNSVVIEYNNLLLNNKIMEGKFPVDDFCKENRVSLSDKNKIIRELNKQSAIISKPFVMKTGGISSKKKLYADYSLMKSLLEELSGEPLELSAMVEAMKKE